MTSIIPPNVPKLTEAAARDILAKHGVTHPVAFIGWRGYYQKTMGDPTRNDRGIYDDAMFIVAPNAFAAFNANVDPTSWGMNPALGKPYAMLNPGLWWYKQGWHKKGSKWGHRAFVQARVVTVTRYVSRDVFSHTETGWFGINIHRGGFDRTSSEGCQTIPKPQWEAFQSLGYSEMDRADIETVPYLLLSPTGVN